MQDLDMTEEDLSNWKLHNKEVVKTIHSLYNDNYKRFKAFVNIVTSQRKQSPKKQRTHESSGPDTSGPASNT